MATTARPRITWVDHAKGLGIFLVVVGHVLRGLHAGGIVADGPAFWFVDSWIYAFHMPLFFLISGLFADRQVERGVGVFVRDKLATLAYPYLVWSTLQTLLQIALSRHTTHQVTVRDLGGILIQPIMQFWFLYALFLISLIYYGLRRSGLRPLGALAAFAVFWATQGWVPVGPWGPLIAARTNGIYYALGSVLNRYGWAGRFERAPAALLAPAVILGYGIIAAWVALQRAATPPLVLALALCGILASMALGVLLSRARALGFVRVLGVYSLEIFLAHTIASAGIRIALVKLLKIDDVTTHLVLGTVGGIALPLMLAWLCRRRHAEFLFRLPQPSKGPGTGTEAAKADHADKEGDSAGTRSVGRPA